MQLHYGAGSTPAGVTDFFTLVAFSLRVKIIGLYQPAIKKRARSKPARSGVLSRQLYCTCACSANRLPPAEGLEHCRQFVVARY